MAATASAARHSGLGVRAWLAGCSEFSRGVLAVHWQPCLRAFVKGRRGGGAHQPGPGSRYRMRPSPRLSSRASSLDTAHLRISWESRTLRCTAQSLSTRPAPMAALELLSPITATLCDRLSISCARPRRVAVESAQVPGTVSPNLGARLPPTSATNSRPAEGAAHPFADPHSYGRLRRRDGANLTPMKPCLLDGRLLDVELP
jgi:hypothetical protein